MTVTEVATLPLKAGSNIDDKSSPAGQSVDAASVIIQRQDGIESIWMGTEVENPTQLQLFISQSIHLAAKPCMHFLLSFPLSHLPSLASVNL